MNTSAPLAPRNRTKTSGLLAILKKEFRRFFTDGRLVFTTILLPGLSIFVLYSLMGGAMTSFFSVSSDYAPQVYVVNMPDSLAAVTAETGLAFEEAQAADVDALKEQVSEKTADLLVIFPADFDERLAQNLSNGNASTLSRETVPQVELFFNSTSMESTAIFSQMSYLLDAYKESVQPVFSVNSGLDTYDLASQEDTISLFLALILPFVLMIFLFTACMALATESIAGEKERGTIATLLVTPLGRWELALGKILTLCCIALLTGASSFIGMILSLPSLMGVNAPEAVEGAGITLLAEANIYGMQDYLMLLAVIFSTVLVFVGLISIISAFARTVKEANTMVLPLMMLVMLVAVTGMFQSGASTEPLLYLVPVYNSVQSMAAIFSFSAEPLLILLTVGINCIAATLCVVILARMFESERVIFSK